MGRGEWWSVLVPDIKGGNSPYYWGEQRFSGGAFYFGAFAFALCLAWLIAGSHWMRWPLLAISALVIVLSWRDASWLTDAFLNNVPLFNKFRDTKMMLVLVQLVVPLGAAMALWELSHEKATKHWKLWLAGGGVRGGMNYGETDELGFEAVTNRVHLHDLHATILHLMGLDHEHLTYFFQGRNESLTDVGGRVIKDIMA